MNKRVVCIGAALVDELYYADDNIMPSTTNLVTLEENAGGVARNLAHQLSLLNIPVSLIAAFGDDTEGEWLSNGCKYEGIDISMCVFGRNCRTGKYTGLINADGSLFTALLSNDCNKLIDNTHLASQIDALIEAAFIIADTNLTADCINWLTEFSRTYEVPLIIEPVSAPPARKLQKVDLSDVFLVTPNEDELPELSSGGSFNHDKEAKRLLDRGVQHVWLHEGHKGSKLYTSTSTIHIPSKTAKVLDSTGAGDGALAGCIWGLYNGKSMVLSIQIGQWLATEVLKVKGAIAKHVSHDQLMGLEFTANE